MNKQPKRTPHTKGELREVFFDSFLTRNMVLVQAIGLCPIVAAGVSLQRGVVLALCTAAVMLPTSLFVSLWGERLPAWARAPVYTLGSAVILLGAAVFLDRVVSHELYAALYVFLPLTAVNTVVYYRAGGFALGKPLRVALTDALASSLGFGVVICVVSSLREIASYGTLWNVQVHEEITLPEAALPYAALLLLGFMAAGLQWLQSRRSGAQGKERAHA